ncbi:MAG: hypothetical protein WBN65_03695 [Gammaproteobacteria bacterium]
MDTVRQARVAFYLTGKRPGAELEPVEGMDLIPALLSRYCDLDSLRHDYPLVLLEHASPAECVQSLSGLFDTLLRQITHGEDGERLSRHLLRLETALRRAAAGGGGEVLSKQWDLAAARIGADEDADLRGSLERARAALNVDGVIAGCDTRLPSRLLGHAWQVAQEHKAARLRDQIARLVQRLSDILKADVARSERGRSAESLEAAIGGSDAMSFDFQAMSALLVRTANQTTITETRRRRLERLLSALGTYDFEPQAFRFDSCVAALDAWRERYPILVDVARAIAIADLEIAGDYREDRHDPYFEEYGADGLAPEDLAPFADYLVCVNAATMDANEQAALMELLSSGLPMKILVQTDDILQAALPGLEPHGFGRSALHFANMAMGLNEVYVLQAPASHLLRCRDWIAEGLAFQGTTIFSVFSGASGFAGNLPPYLLAAAAVESRAFPIFSFSPVAGADLASRFFLSGNPQTDLDWPLHLFSYEDRERRGVTEAIAFTFVDFAALDERFARHLARVPANARDEQMISVGEALAAENDSETEKIPCILMVDGQNNLQHVLVDERLLREARRCREAWHSLQEFGGIHNSHAQRLLEAARREREQEAELATDAAPEPPAISAQPEASPEAAPIEDTAEPSPDEAYIETPRCTTCNECTQINDKMFAYDENRQAYIADRGAGTYAQLVEAAESCQVSIIHPGKPIDPDEPGLDDLIKRAEPFL